MPRTPFQDYLAEYETSGIGPLLYSLILEIVAQVSKHYPPNIYSPNQQWDEDATVALTHDFAIDKLIEAGWLEHHLLTQETTRGLEQVLRRDYRHFLISRRQRTEYLNLYERVKRILADEGRFKARYEHPNSAASLWGRATWDSTSGDSPVQDIAEVVEAMFEVELPPLVRYRADSKKLSHLLSQRELTRLLEETFLITGKPVRMDSLMEALRYRLGLLETASISLQDPVGNRGENGSQTYADLISDPGALEATLSNQEAAEDIFERLTDRQRHVLAFYSSLQAPTLETIGEAVGVSKSTIQNELKVITIYISSTVSGQEDAERTITNLSEICGRYMAETTGSTEPD